MLRRTLSEPALFRGRGLHGGRHAVVAVLPAAAGSGIRFRRTDLPGSPPIPARHDFVRHTCLSTCIGHQEARVATVEHLMAALLGCGITDVEIRVHGPEIPALDGSALNFARGLLAAGLRDLPAPLRAVRILRAVRVSASAGSAMLVPAERFEMAFLIRFEATAIGTQSLDLVLAGDALLSELADSRTFGCLGEVEALHRRGFGLGGGLDNAVIVDGPRVLNPEGLRHADEFVRHKMLDAAGDLALAGAPIIGRYVGVRAGHTLSHRLLCALFTEPGAWCWSDCRPDQVPGGAVSVPVPQPVAMPAAL